MKKPSWLSLLFLQTLFLSTYSFSAMAADEQQRLRIVYGSPSWNINSVTMDSAVVFLKNKHTGQIIKVVLDESEPDSAKFVGDFSLPSKEVKDLLAYEAFIPPQNIRGSDEAVKKFNQLLAQRKVEKKPMAVRDNRGRTNLELFDTAEQADRAEKVYEQERLAAGKENPKLTQAQQLMIDSEKTDAQKKQEKEVAQREADRMRAEQIERQKILQRQEQQEKLSQAQKAAQLEQAKKLAEQGMADYQAGRFSTAEENFKKSAELDPNNNSFYYQYAVTLYKNNKADQALISFSSSKVDKSLENEKKYYMALCHYRLKELSSAEPLFRQVGESDDKVLAPSAEFYRGYLLYEQEKFQEAKTSFEKVIDTSSDPQLDRKSEEMIETILQAIEFKEQQSKRWNLGFTVGAMYDSNVLLAQDNQTSQGTALKMGDTRYLLAGSVENRAVVTKDWEWVPKFSTFYIYSVHKEVAQADPFLATIYLPINWKSLFLDKNSQWSVGPGYETLFMDTDSSGNRENILNSTFINGKQNLAIRGDWMSTHELEVRQDKSLLNSSTGDNDYSAMRYTIRVTEAFFLNPARSEMIMPSIGYIVNDAKGKNRSYRRFELGTTYVHPTKNFGAWVTSLAFYQLHYSLALPTRTDTNVTLSTGFSKPLTTSLNWGVTSSYSNNTSDSESNQYSKFTVLGVLSWNKAL